MATVAQEVDNVAVAATTVACTVAAATGNLLVALWVIRNGSALTSIVGSSNGAFTQVATGLASARAGIHYFENSANGSETVTLTAGASDTLHLLVLRVTGAATASSLDQSNTASTASDTTISHGSINASANAGLIVTVAGQGATVSDETVATDFTQGTMAVGGNLRQWWQYRTTGAASYSGTASYTAVTAHGAIGVIASFLDAAGGSSIAAISNYHRRLRVS